MIAPVKFLGLQESVPPLRPMELYNLTAAIPQHGVGSTVSRRDLERAGYTPPPSELAKAADAWHQWNNSAPGDDHHFPLTGGSVSDGVAVPPVEEM